MQNTILLFLALSFALQDSIPPRLAEVDVVRQDEKNRRVFIVRSEASVEDTTAVRRFLVEVEVAVRASHPDWTNDWVASIFSQRRFAGYKDEPEIQSFVATGVWQKGYLAEYSPKERVCTLFPLLPTARREIRLSK